MKPQVSVIVPFYNAAETLCAAIKTLQDQTLGDWECLCIDDGSEDASSDAVLQAMRRDVRFKVFRQPNAGVSVARNRGLDAASGRFIFFLDADDTLTPDCLERCVAAWHEGVQWVEGGLVRVDDCGRRIGQKDDADLPMVALSREALPHYPDIKRLREGSASGKLWDRAWIEACGLRFNPLCRVAEDSLFVLQAMMQVERIVLLGGEPCYRYLAPNGRGSLSDSNVEVFIASTRYSYAYLQAPSTPRDAMWRFLNARWMRDFARMVTGRLPVTASSGRALREMKVYGPGRFYGYRSVLCWLVQHTWMPIGVWVIMCKVCNIFYPLKVFLFKTLLHKPL